MNRKQILAMVAALVMLVSLWGCAGDGNVAILPSIEDDTEPRVIFDIFDLPTDGWTDGSETEWPFYIPSHTIGVEFDEIYTVNEDDIDRIWEEDIIEITEENSVYIFNRAQGTAGWAAIDYVLNEPLAILQNSWANTYLYFDVEVADEAHIHFLDVFGSVIWVDAAIRGDSEYGLYTGHYRGRASLAEIIRGVLGNEYYENFSFVLVGLSMWVGQGTLAVREFRLVEYTNFA
ncbi:MAG: hypothetical protein FWE06_01360 [Oscillospiraceae bacterium]|nr:hypothetical protein [Oscillospiraceae bacterium]